MAQEKPHLKALTKIQSNAGVMLSSKHGALKYDLDVAIFDL
jgi:hypothetical protein